MECAEWYLDGSDGTHLVLQTRTARYSLTDFLVKRVSGKAPVPAKSCVPREQRPNQIIGILFTDCLLVTTT